MLNARSNLFVTTIKQPATVRRALVACFALRGLFITINQLDHILSREMPWVSKILLTCFTPRTLGSYCATAVTGRENSYQIVCAS